MLAVLLQASAQSFDSSVLHLSAKLAKIFGARSNTLRLCYMPDTTAIVAYIETEQVFLITCISQLHTSAAPQTLPDTPSQLPSVPAPLPAPHLSTPFARSISARRSTTYNASGN